MFPFWEDVIDTLQPATQEGQRFAQSRSHLVLKTSVTAAVDNHYPEEEFQDDEMDSQERQKFAEPMALRFRAKSLVVVSHLQAVSSISRRDGAVDGLPSQIRCSVASVNLTSRRKQRLIGNATLWAKGDAVVRQHSSTRLGVGNP